MWENVGCVPFMYSWSLQRTPSCLRFSVNDLSTRLCKCAWDQHPLFFPTTTVLCERKVNVKKMPWEQWIPPWHENQPLLLSTTWRLEGFCKLPIFAEYYVLCSSKEPGKDCRVLYWSSFLRFFFCHHMIVAMIGGIMQQKYPLCNIKDINIFHFNIWQRGFWQNCSLGWLALQILQGSWEVVNLAISF